VKSVGEILLRDAQVLEVFFKVLVVADLDEVK